MKYNLHTFLLALILLFMSWTVADAQSQSLEDSGNSNRPGAISGRVYNDLGQPLANAVVTVRTFNSRDQGRTAITDDKGGFRVSGLDPVLYIVSASFPTYVPAPRDPDVNPVGYCSVGESVTLRLIKGGVITGTVTDSTGKPVVAVPVRSYMVRDRTGQVSRSGALKERTTDDRGVYRIYGLEMGTYVVYTGGESDVNRYKTTPFDTDAPTYFPSSTRDTAVEVTVNPDEEKADVDIRYRGEPGQVVSGVASSSQAFEENSTFQVTLSSVVNGVSQSSVTTFQYSDTHAFTFHSVADGDYDLTARLNFTVGEWAISEPRRIKVKGGDVSGIELVTKPLGSISGRIELEESKAIECKDKPRPLFGETLVTAWHNEKIAAKDQPQFLWELGEPALPDKFGSITLRNLAPGEYRFNARTTAKYWYLRSITLQNSAAHSAKANATNVSIDAARNWTGLKPGERLSGLTITLAEGAASFRGQIKLPEGEFLPPKLFVYLVPADPDKADHVLRFFASMVSTDGSFALINLPPGRYWAIAQAAGVNESNVLSRLRLPDETEVRARLQQEAEAAKIKIELKPCQNVTDYQFPFNLARPLQNRGP
jgi:hypothetical protein